MELVIPLPISKNDAYDERPITSKAKIVPAVQALIRGEKGAWHKVQRALAVTRSPSAAYLEYRKEVEQALIGQTCHVFEGDVQLHALAYFPNRRRDLPNIVDVLLDVLEGVCYTNDRQVKDMRVTWALDADDPRCVVRVESMQPDLFAPPGPPLQMEF